MICIKLNYCFITNFYARIYCVFRLNNWLSLVVQTPMMYVGGQLGQFSLTGRKSGKLAFKETRFYHVTKEAVKLSCTATEKDIDVGIMELLKHVKDRSAKQKR